MYVVLVELLRRVSCLHAMLCLQMTAGQEVILRNSLAWTLLYHGLPIVYYGTEQPAIAGVADQRTAMWPHYGTDTPMYGWLAQVNAIRKKYGLSHGGACRSFSTPLLCSAYSGVSNCSALLCAL